MRKLKKIVAMLLAAVLVFTGMPPMETRAETPTATIDDVYSAIDGADEDACICVWDTNYEPVAKGPDNVIEFIDALPECTINNYSSYGEGHWKFITPQGDTYSVYIWGGHNGNPCSNCGKEIDYMPQVVADIEATESECMVFAYDNCDDIFLGKEAVLTELQELSGTITALSYDSFDYGWSSEVYFSDSNEVVYTIQIFAGGHEFSEGTCQKCGMEEQSGSGPEVIEPSSLEVEVTLPTTGSSISGEGELFPGATFNYNTELVESMQSAYGFFSDFESEEIATKIEAGSTYTVYIGLRAKNENEHPFTTEETKNLTEEETKAYFSSLPSEFTFVSGTLKPARFVAIFTYTVEDDTSTTTVGDYDLVVPKNVTEPDSSQTVLPLPTEINSEYNRIEWSTGWYVVNGDVNITKYAYVDGDVNLILDGNLSMSYNAGAPILIKKDSKLTIWSTEDGGKLSIKQSGSNECIVPIPDISNCNIVINSGDIELTSDSVVCVKASIEMNGGKLKITSGAFYGSWQIPENGSGTINGGSVEINNSFRTGIDLSNGASLNISGDDANVSISGGTAVQSNGTASIAIDDKYEVKVGDSKESTLTKVTLGSGETWSSKLSPASNAPKYVKIAPKHLPGIDEIKTDIEGKYFVGFDSECDNEGCHLARVIMLGKDKDGDDAIINARGTSAYYHKLSSFTVKAPEYEGAAYRLEKANMVFDIICTGEEITAIHFNEDTGDHVGTCNVAEESNITDTDVVLDMMGDFYFLEEDGEKLITCDVDGDEFTYTYVFLDNMVLPVAVAYEDAIKINDTKYVIMVKMDASKTTSHEDEYIVLALTVENGKVTDMNFAGFNLILDESTIHTHNFSYSVVNGSTLKATCGNTTDCDLTTSDKSVSLTLTASSANYSGSLSDDAITKSAWSTVVDGLATASDIYYVSQDGTTYAESTAKPTVAGSYYAKVYLLDGESQHIKDSSSNDIYAQVAFTFEPYTLTINPNGGTYSNNTIVTVTVGSKLNTGLGTGKYNCILAPERSGYEFAGWYTEATGGIPVFDTNGYAVRTSDSPYWDGGTNYAPEWMGGCYADWVKMKWNYNGNLTVYAHWNHTHQFDFTASDNVLTATCSKDASHKYSLTLSASSANYSGSAVTANYGEGEVDTWEGATEISAPVIAYQQKVGNEWKAMKEGTAPTAVGAYRALAKLTVEEQDYIAYKEYSINPLAIKEVEFTTPKVEVNGEAATTVDGIPKEAKYTGTISWSPEDGKFKYDTAYTATVTLTAADNYEFTKDVSIPEGWTKDKSSTATKLVLTKTYPKTKAEEEKKPEVDKVPDVTVSYQTHIQTYGDSQGYKKNGEVAGTTGESKRLEAIKIKVAGNSNVQVAYTTHVQTIGWLPWSNNNELSGTTGEAKRMEAIKIQLKGADADKYDVYYRVHSQTYGWLAWAKNGQPAGTAGLAKRLEGIQVVVVEKGKAVDKNLGGIKSANDKAYIEGTTKTSDSEKYVNEVPNVLYKTHVQTFGWQNWKANGSVAGTTGLYKRIEGIQIKLTNCAYEGGIQYMTHVQTAGWDKKWNADGALAGTTGISKRLEGIRIELTGEMAKHYDVYYRVHSQTYGWLGWAKNGESAGSEGHKKRLEGIQIVLVEKGGKAPANNYGGVVSKTSKSFIK